jgi:hypothetical protein
MDMKSAISTPVLCLRVFSVLITRHLLFVIFPISIFAYVLQVFILHPRTPARSAEILHYANAKIGYSAGSLQPFAYSGDGGFYIRLRNVTIVD